MASRCLCLYRSLSRSPLSQSRSDARTKNESISHALRLVGLVVMVFVGDCQGGTTMKALYLRTICAFVQGFPAPDWH